VRVLAASASNYAWRFNSVSEETDQGQAELTTNMVARIESDGVGSPVRERAITDALSAIDGVSEVRIATGAIHVTYDPLKTSEKNIEESIRASGNDVAGAKTDSEIPHPDLEAGSSGDRR